MTTCELADMNSINHFCKLFALFFFFCTVIQITVQSCLFVSVTYNPPYSIKVDSAVYSCRDKGFPGFVRAFHYRKAQAGTVSSVAVGHGAIRAGIIG